MRCIIGFTFLLKRKGVRHNDIVYCCGDATINFFNFNNCAMYEALFKKVV